jgi:hypothetical protein
VTCRVLGLSKQALYQWKARPVSQRDWDDAHLINAAIDIHHDDPEFGYRFITDELPARGVTAGRNRVNRLCTLQRLWSVHSRKRGRHRQPGPPVHDDLVRREFTAPAPNRLWLTDISEHPTAEGKLYLCAVKDACSKRIVGYSIDERMTAELAVIALRNAVALRGPADATVHSDRGSQFRSHAYQRALREAGLRGSMGPGRDLRRQRRHGVVLQSAAEERPQPPTLDHTPGPAAGDHRMDREDLPPSPTPRHPRPAHAHRVRDTSAGRSRGLIAPTYPSQRNSGQTLWSHSAMAKRYQHVTAAIRSDVAERVGALLWTANETTSETTGDGAAARGAV